MQGQACDSAGKKENCIVTVNRVYARDGFHCLLDGELYLPEYLSSDLDRCREAGIADEVVYRPKWKIALALYDWVMTNGPHFDFVNFDEGYSRKPEFLRGQLGRSQKYLGEEPRNFKGEIKAPRVVIRRHRKHGRGRKLPRPASGRAPSRRAEAMLDQVGYRNQP